MPRMGKKQKKKKLTEHSRNRYVPPIFGVLSPKPINGAGPTKSEGWGAGLRRKRWADNGKTTIANKLRPARSSRTRNKKVFWVRFFSRKKYKAQPRAWPSRVASLDYTREKKYKKAGPCKKLPSNGSEARREINLSPRKMALRFPG